MRVDSACAWERANIYGLVILNTYAFAYQGVRSSISLKDDGRMSVLVNARGRQTGNYGLFFAATGWFPLHSTPLVPAL